MLKKHTPKKHSPRPQRGENNRTESKKHISKKRIPKSHKKKWGQHFLRSERYLRKITESLPECEVALEIGAGPGNLTRHALKKISHLLYVSEIDPRFFKSLEQLSPKIKLLRGDFLKQEIEKLTPAPEAIFGNLPYQITSKIMEKTVKYYLSKSSSSKKSQEQASSHQNHTLFRKPPPSKKSHKSKSPAEILKPAIFLVQKEVALRIAATPGSRDYSRLTVLISTAFEARKLFDVPPGAFSPPPEVTSSLVKLVPLRKPLIKAHEVDDFIGFVRELFNQRNRKLIKVLRKTLTKIITEGNISNSKAPSTGTTTSEENIPKPGGSSKTQNTGATLTDKNTSKPEPSQETLNIPMPYDRLRNIEALLEAILKEANKKSESAEPAHPEDPRRNHKDKTKTENKIHPEKRIDHLSPDEFVRLYRATKKTLKKAIRKTTKSLPGSPHP